MLVIHIISFFIFRAFVLYTLKILEFGCSVISFRYTILFYLGMSVLVAYMSYFIYRKKAQGFIMGFVILMMLLLGTEALLRYGVKTKATYIERKGGKFYQSRYQQRQYIKTKNTYNINPWRFAHIPNTERWESSSEFSYLHTYNNEGIRDDSIPLIKDQNEVRVLCLGDSYTEGIGAPQDSTWAQLLEDKLNNAYKDKKFNCMNAGVAGSDPIDGYYILEKLVKYQPDLVLLCINNTEPSDISMRGGFDRFTDGELKYNYGPRWEPFFAFSYIVRHISMDVFHYTYELKTVEKMNKEMEKAYDTLEEAIHKLSTFAAANNAAFAVILIPTDEELLAGHTYMDSFMEHLAYTSNINIIYTPPCFDNLMLTNGQYNKKYYWDIDRHLNSNGYAVLAECIFNKLDMQTQ